MLRTKLALLLMATSGLFGQTASAQQEPCCQEHGHTCLRKWNRSQYSQMGRQSVVDALAAQSDKGRILSMTIWNYHFNPETAELLPSGVSLLNRLRQRQAGYPTMDVFLQTSFDVPYDPSKPVSELVAARQRLDQERTKAVQEYVTLVLHRELEPIVVYDPDQVGMSSIEASQSVQKMYSEGPAGVLSERLIEGISITEEGGVR